MFNTYKIKLRLNWPLIRAHICTAAVAFSFNSTWRVPRDAFRFGGVTYGLVFMASMIFVAFPIALLQLSVGQLSQQDAVGIWRAVPFFKGVGYLRLLIAYLASIYTITFVGITTTIFFYSLNNSSAPFWDAEDILLSQENNASLVYNTSCVNETILVPIHEQPEHYMAMGLITSVLWVLFPIILYSPVKFMKKTFYGVLPVVLILAIAVVICLGDKGDIGLVYDQAEWIHFIQPEIWYRTIIQALWSAQIAGGYLISAGDTLYSCTDVVWTTGIFIVMNILASWFGLILWYAIGGNCEKDTSVLAVLQQTYKLIEEKNLSATWASLVFAFLFSSGAITILTLLYPLFERFKRISDCKWRYLAAGSSLVGIGAAWAVLAAGPDALTLMDDTIVPILISIATVLEICPFIFIYGWRVLIEDIEFLVGRDISKYWVWGWCVSMGIILSSFVWWLVFHILDSSWQDSSWFMRGLVAAASASLATVVIFATISVVRQVQYDVIGKLKSSFKPSRHWGPRDPIAHHYWLTRRREDFDRDQPRTRYNRRQLGQFAGNTSFLNVNNNPVNVKDRPVDKKRRSNSDDWLYISRKQHIADTFQECKLNSKKRSKSLDLDGMDVKRIESKKEPSTGSSGEVQSVESVSLALETNKYVKHM